MGKRRTLILVVRDAFKPPLVYRLRAAIWMGLAIPTLLWWKDSVLWVAVLSLYANYATEIGNWRAAQAKDAAEHTEHNAT